MTITIKEVKFGSAAYKKLLEIRDEVLRRPIGMKLRKKDTALDAGEFHIAAFDGRKIIGCVLLRPLTAQTVKLRQMAVLGAYRGKGIGARLVRHAEKLAIKKGFSEIEANARQTAQAFYEKLGYGVVSEPFLEVKLHTLKMHKLLRVF